MDKPEYFTDELYASSAALTAAVCDRYGVPKTYRARVGSSPVTGW